MAVHGRNTAVLLDSADISTYLNSSTFAGTADVAETSTYQSPGGAKTYVAGLKDGSITLGGLYDSVADTLMIGELLLDPGKPITVGYEGLALGARVKLARTRLTTYAPSSPVGGVVAFSANIQADRGVDTGISLAPLTARTTTANGTAIDNGVLTSNGGVGVLHVTAVTGTTPNAVIKVQHSVDNSVWVDLVTFTAATAAGSQYIEVAGTVNRWLRAIWTITGTTPSFTFATSFARR